MRVIAVTGEIGAGKSAVSRIIENLGGVRLDADAAALKLWKNKDIKNAAVSRWGGVILDKDGEIIYSQIARLIFSPDLPNARVDYKWCCSLIHPLVMLELETQVINLKNDNNFKLAVVEVPLLFEVGREHWDKWVDDVIFVTAPRETRIKRCAERGWDEKELTRRENYYLPAGERMKQSDFVINNDGDLESLVFKIISILK